MLLPPDLIWVDVCEERWFRIRNKQYPDVRPYVPREELEKAKLCVCCEHRGCRCDATASELEGDEPYLSRSELKVEIKRLKGKFELFDTMSTQQWMCSRCGAGSDDSGTPSPETD
jgi:hypothetical protein